MVIGRTRFQRRLWSVIAMLALLVAYSPSMASEQIFGWGGTHGHVTLSGYVAPHSHPWDRQPADPAVDVAPAEGAAGVVFTFSDGGLDVGGPMIVPDDGAMPVRPDAPALTDATPARAPTSAPVDVPKPRPRA